MTKRLLTPSEVAELLRISDRTVIRWLNKGAMRGIKVGKQWRIPVEVVEAILGPLPEGQPKGEQRAGRERAGGAQRKRGPADRHGD